VTDWTLIITTLGTAGLAGSFGYFTARQQNKVALRQIEAESDRLREQHREDHLRNRQGTYHAFIVADEELGAHLTLPIGIQPEEMDAVTRRHAYAAAGVMLFGASEVQVALAALQAKYVEIGELLEPDPNNPAAFVRKASEIYVAHVEELNELRYAVLDAMRADVGPDRRVLGRDRSAAEH
jgi:hypothetical protein